MPTNDILRELNTPAAVPDLPVFEAIVGDSLNFSNAQTAVTPTTTLLQKPSGSSAVVASNSFTCDLPGVYLVAQASGGTTRNFTVYCFTVAQVTTPQPANRSALRRYVGLMGALGVGQTSILRTTLESAAPNNVVIGINWSVY